MKKRGCKLSLFPKVLFNSKHSELVLPWVLSLLWDNLERKNDAISTFACILKLKFHVHLSLKVMGSWLAWGDGASLKVNSVLHWVQEQFSWNRRGKSVIKEGNCNEKFHCKESGDILLSGARFFGQQRSLVFIFKFLILCIKICGMIFACPPIFHDFLYCFSPSNLQKKFQHLIWLNASSVIAPSLSVLEKVFAPRN